MNRRTASASDAVRRAAGSLLFAFLAACAAGPTSPTPTPTPTSTLPPPTATSEPVWVTIASDLAADPAWLAEEVRLDFDMQIAEGVLIVAAPADLYANPILTAGSSLQAAGNFGVRFELEAASAEFAGLSLYGALAQGEWWEGITRLDVGIKTGKVAVGYWNGSSPTPAVWQEFAATGVFTNRRVELALRKAGEAFLVLANGRVVGQLPDPGLFSAGRVVFGLNVAPQNRLTLYSLSVEADNGAGVTVLP